jgi:flagellin
MLISLLRNPYAVAATRSLREANKAFAQSLERIASGRKLDTENSSRVNLALNLEAELKSLGAAGRNAEDVNSMIQMAEGGLSQISNSLIRLRELAIEAASDTLSDSWRQGITIEANQLRDEIDGVAGNTGWRSLQLLNGSSNKLSFQIGTENTDDGQITMDLSPLDARVSALGISSVDLSSSEDALDSLSAIDLAIGRVEDARAYTGGFAARVDSIKNLITNEYLLGSERLSRLRDTDLASEATQLFLNDLRQKTSITLLAQANLQSASVLKLLDMK